MTRKELLESVNLKEELIAKGRGNRPGDAIVVKKLTIHNTDNTSAGADANAHSSFVRNTGYYMLNGKKNWVSWHYTVDDTRAIRQLPEKERAYHAGSSANSSSVAMEICMHKGNNQVVANDRAARLAALILHDNKLGIGDLVTHNSWTGKNCPSLLMEATKWTAFKKAVKGYLDSISGTAVPKAKAVAKTAPAAFKFKACWCGKPSEHDD